MKLSRIKKLCKESKTITLTDKIDEAGEILQFAGDGQSLYPLRGLPYMDEAALLNVMDIPENELPKWNVLHEKTFPSWINTDDMGNDCPLKRLMTGISYHADLVVCEMKNDSQILFDRAYLGPLEGDYSIFWRSAPGSVENGYVVAKKGMFFEAMWLPDVLPPAAREELRIIAGRL